MSSGFMLKVGSNTDQPPKRLIRISNNNRILEAQGKELSYDTLDHTSEEVTTDQIIGSFGTEAFDFENRKILYDCKTQ